MGRVRLLGAGTGKGCAHILGLAGEEHLAEETEGGW